MDLKVSDLQAVLAILCETCTQLENQALATDTIDRLKRNLGEAKSVYEELESVFDSQSPKTLFARFRTEDKVQRQIEKLQSVRRGINEMLSVLAACVLKVAIIECWLNQSSVLSFPGSELSWIELI